MRLVAKLGSPHASQELGVHHDAAGIRAKLREQFPLGAREPDLLAVDGDLATIEIDFDAGIDQGAPTRVFDGPGGAPQYRGDPRDELVRIEWLGQVVVSA